MKKISKKLIVGALAGTMVLSAAAPAAAAPKSASMPGIMDMTNFWEQVLQGSYKGKQLPQVILADSKVVIPYTEGNKVKVMAVSTGNGKLSYESSDEEVATVNSKGVVTFKKAGEVTITIKAAETKKFKAAVKKVTVIAKEKKVTVKVDGKKVKANVYKGEDGVYMTMEDLGRILNDTDSEFSVAVDANNKIVETYLDDEFQKDVVIDSEAPEKAPAAWTLNIDGVAAQMIRTLEEDGKVYFNLKDVSVLYGIKTKYNAKKAKLTIKSGVGYSLDLDAEDYETGSIMVYGEEVKYRVYTAVSCTNPDVVAQEVLKIYVPENATEDSPVFMPLKTGAHRHAEVAAPMDVDETNINKDSSGTVGTGAMQAASYLMSKGWVVLSAAGRGYDTVAEKNGVEYMAGTAPSCITDFKAAIRYMQHNDDVIPGDPDKIVITGTSGGGTMTSVMGASGNSEFFDPYLEAIGAADESDAIYAAVPYCPVADIDNQGMAYEWAFYGNDCPGRADEFKALTNEISKLYAPYVNGLGLSDEEGNALTLNPETLDGSYKEYYGKKNAEGLTHYMKNQGYVAEDGTLTEAGHSFFYDETIKGVKVESERKPCDLFTWSTEDGGQAVFRMENYSEFASVYVENMFFMKGCPSFDNGLVYGDVTKSSIDSINQLFNTNPQDLTGWNHFEMNLGTAVANANNILDSEYFKSEKGTFEISDEAQKLIAMYNPLYYIKDYSGVAEEGLQVNNYADDMFGSSDPAPYWRLRVGSWDHLVSPSAENTFALVLDQSEKVEDVDFMIAWNMPHTGWFDNTEMIQWLSTIPGLEF